MCTLNINPSLNSLVGDLSLHLQCVKYQGCVSSYQKSFIGGSSKYNPLTTFVEDFHQWSHPCHQQSEIPRWHNCLSQYLHEQWYGNCIYGKQCNAETVDRSLTGCYDICCRLEQWQSDASQYHKVINRHIHPQEINIRWGNNNIWSAFDGMQYHETPGGNSWSAHALQCPHRYNYRTRPTNADFIIFT